MSTEVSAPKRAHLLQKRIFRTLEAEARVLMGEPPSSIRNYEKEYQRDFKVPKLTPSALNKNEFIERVRNVDVTFVADFHPFNQAQRTALRILRDAIDPNQTWMLGLELVPSQFQSELDDFQTGKLSTEDFHQAISYASEWGFPWKNYLPLFDWARENQIRLIALNRPKTVFLSKEEHELHQRDQWAAGVITDIFHQARQRNENPKMMVLYGEHHLGSTHLPRQLDKISEASLSAPLSWIAVHQNQERLYWRLAGNHPEIHSTAFEIKPSIFCVFTSPPWAKLQSLVSWAEGETPAEADDCDYLSLIKTYGTTVAEFFSIPPPSFEALSTFTIEEADFLDHTEAHSHFTSEELRWIRFHINTNHRLYIPRLEIAYLGTPSHNGAAELASVHLFRSVNRIPHFFQPSETDFMRLILETAFGFLGSLILNPHRQCDLPTDHQRRLKQLQDGKRQTFPGEIEARKIALGAVRKRPYPGMTLSTVLTQRRMTPAAMIGARYAGRVFGKHLHHAVLTEKAALEDIRALFFATVPRSKSADAVDSKYRRLQDLLASVPMPAGRRDRL